MYLKPVKQSEIVKYCQSLSSNASGCDDISPVIVKLCTEYISKPITYLINLCFKDSTFAEKLKLAKVIPLHKSGSKSDVKNKRPISIPSAFSKIFEKAMTSRLLDYVLMN